MPRLREDLVEGQAVLQVGGIVVVEDLDEFRSSHVESFVGRYSQLPSARYAADIAVVDLVAREGRTET